MHTYIIDVKVSNPNVGSFRLVSSSVFVPSRKWNLKNPTVTMSMIDNLLRMEDNLQDWFITKRQELLKSARVAMEALLWKPRSFRNVLNLAIKFTKAIVLVPLCVLAMYAVMLIRVGIAGLIGVPVLFIFFIVVVGVRYGRAHYLFFTRRNRAGISYDDFLDKFCTWLVNNPLPPFESFGESTPYWAPFMWGFKLEED
ncbi:hypothetical protein D8674_029463 [Pyrus ussuriensis x Pyrus communis]|uniref:Uncharacterized protein n=1 Tax=Pyrus ussuriensis x Pyrus communis TaxID=2448454 RepID=A0A5N5HZ66_9ROSA|nr:hypothetical protein D8674_029463 [Pyrus ussuriensis x Pyrus communis]